MTAPAAEPLQVLTIRITTVGGHSRDIQVQYTGDPTAVLIMWAKSVKADGQLLTPGLIVPWEQMVMAEVVATPQQQAVPIMGPMGRLN